MDRMKHPFAALVCTLILTASAQAEVVLPRLSPLDVVGADGKPTGTRVMVPFGLPLELLDRGLAGGTVAMVQAAGGAAFAVLATDLIAPTAAQTGLVAMAEPGRNSGLRPNMPLWDSVARARLYLQGAAADSLRPALTELPGGVFPALGLPVFAVESAPTSIGRPVMMAGAWVPVMPEALDPSDSSAPPKVVLHVLVDGSDYARDFTLESLQQVSRVVAQGDKIAGFTRQVIYDNGALRNEGEVPAAGLRAEWPEAGGGTGGTLTDALAAALDGLATRIVQGDGAAHVVLVLVGPGLGADPEALARVAAAGENLADLRGVVLVQGTPEPNPANDMVLRQMAGGTAARFLDFGGDVMGAVEGVISTAPAEDATTLAAWRGKVCALAADRALPCVIGAPGVLPPVAAAEWVALPLWFVIDGAALDLVPAGMAPPAARLAQNEIRACHALGQVWDVAAAGCAASAATLPDDARSLRADLVAMQGEVYARSQERDLALDDLSRKTADWDDQRITLRAEADEALAKLADAQAMMESRAETIAAQEALLSDQAASVADLTDQAEAYAMSVSDLGAERDAALADIARLGGDLDDRDAALVVAKAEVADLTATRDAALADLARTQDDLAAARAKGEGLTTDLAALTSAQTAAEAALRQERAEWQGKADAAAQALADLSATQAAQEGQVADMTGQLADITATHVQLAAQVADLTGQLANAIAARDQSTMQVSDLTAVQADLEGQVSDLAGQLANTIAARDQSVIQVSDLTAVQIELERQISELSGRLADATAASEQSAMQVTDLLAAQAAFAGHVADLTRQLTDQTAARTIAEKALSSAEAAAEKLSTDVDAAAKKASAELLVIQADFVMAVVERDDLAAQLLFQTARANDLEAIKGDLSLTESEIRADHASVTRQLAEAQAKQVELENARMTALTEAATVRATLAEAQVRQAELDTALTSALAESANAEAAWADARAAQAELSTAHTTALAEAANAQAALAEVQAKLAKLDGVHTMALAEAATAKADLAEARAKQAELETAQATAAAEAATVQAALAEAQAQGVAAADRVAALERERDALTEQVATTPGDAAMIVQGLTNRLAQAEDEVARLTANLVVAATTEEMAAPAEDAMVQAANPTPKPKKPKPRPASNVATAAKAPSQTVTARAKPAAKVAAAAPVAPAPQPSASRRVAPASDARQLKGCQFQWVGQEGRLVCP